MLLFSLKSSSSRPAPQSLAKLGRERERSGKERERGRERERDLGFAIDLRW